jgi:chromosome segregation ATPase
MEESMKELKDELEEKIQRVESIQRQMDDANVQLAHYKHEYNLAVARSKDAKADFQKCHEKELDVMNRLAMLKKQVEDTNNNLTAKISEIVNLHKKIKKLDKMNRELNRDMQRCGDVIKQTRDEVKTVRSENKHQKEALRENDVRVVRMKNQMDKLLRERDLIANQMLRRTDENEVLEREVTSLQLTVERGDSRYNERLEDIRMMTNEIKSLRSQCNVLKRGLQNTADMRQEVLILHRKLNQERSKGKVLAGEMLTPMNVHRWRKLNHGDPKRMEMVIKCQRAQKNSLLQSMKVTKCEEIIKGLEGKIELLEAELNRRSTGDVHQKLMMTRVSLRLIFSNFFPTSFSQNSQKCNRTKSE